MASIVSPAAHRPALDLEGGGQIVGRRGMGVRVIGHGGPRKAAMVGSAAR
jgi:hypothetical protein